MTPHPIRAALAALLTSSLLTGCTHLGGNMAIPGDGDVLSHPDGFSSKTRDQLLDDALAQTHELAQFVGGEWRDSGVPSSVFDPNDRSGWVLGACDIPVTAEQYTIFVQQLVDPETFDPDPITENVRAQWESLGYDIHQLGPVPTDDERLRSIDVNFPYNARLSFSASTTNMTILITSECVQVED